MAPCRLLQAEGADARGPGVDVRDLRDHRGELLDWLHGVPRLLLHPWRGEIGAFHVDKRELESTYVHV